MMDDYPDILYAWHPPYSFAEACVDDRFWNGVYSTLQALLIVLALADALRLKP
jgi:hypothetical protein